MFYTFCRFDGKFMAARGRIRRFIEAARPPHLIAFATCSTEAALPVSLTSMETEMGISPRVASFVLPLTN